jgi:ribosomal protein S11
MSTSRLLTTRSISDTDVNGYRSSRRKATPVAAQLAFRNANNDLLIVGAPVLLSERHAKVRREGYRR